MHLIESYATNCGAKIDKPFILEKFFPTTIDKYITLHPFSKGAKSYDYWQTVVDILHPELIKNGIVIAQLGEAKEEKFKNCIHFNGATSLGQVAYVIKRALLHLGVDSFPMHMSAAMNQKLVGLYPYCNIKNVGPYWGDKKRQTIFVGESTSVKPSYAFEEHPKSINSIKPEEISRAVCKHLNIKLDYPYETLFTGDSFRWKTIESVPNQVVDISGLGINNIIMRMDLLFNERSLVGQLSACPCTIVTDRPIDDKIIQAYRSGIKELVYVIRENDNPEFAQKVERLGIQYSLLSELPEKELQDKKINYMDLDKAAILKSKTRTKDDIKELKDIDTENLYYRSSCVILSDSKAYVSEADWLEDDPVKYFDEIKKVKNTDRFWKYAEKYMIMKKID